MDTHDHTATDGQSELEQVVAVAEERGRIIEALQAQITDMGTELAVTKHNLRAAVQERDAIQQQADTARSEAAMIRARADREPTDGQE